MSRRTDRVNELLRVELSELIHREVKDPRVNQGLVSITEVQVSPDLKHATVYVSHLGDEAAHREVLGGLQHAAPFLHGELMKRLKMRNVPMLHFALDPSIERGAHLTALIAEVRERDAGVG
jgi:ribosome-binding factor A